MIKILIIILIQIKIISTVSASEYYSEFNSDKNILLFTEEDIKRSPIYEIELIVFKQNKIFEEDFGLHTSKTKLNYPEDLIFLNEKNIDNLFNKIEVIKEIDSNGNINSYDLFLNEKKSFENLYFRSKAKKLIDSGYSILFHESWVQKILPKEVSLAMPISGGSKFNENFELQGYIKLYKDRYFHLHTNLWLSIFKDSNKNTNFMNDFENNKNISSLFSEQLITVPPPPIDIYGEKYREEAKWSRQLTEEINSIVNEIFQESYVTNDEININEKSMNNSDEYKNDEKRYAVEKISILNQSKKIFLENLYYLDHPNFGLIIYIKKYEYSKENN